MTAIGLPSRTVARMQYDSGQWAAAAHTMREAGLIGFSDDAQKAITENPAYFVWWYTVKSVGLCVVAAGLAFMIGRATAHKR